MRGFAFEGEDWNGFAWDYDVLAPNVCLDNPNHECGVVSATLEPPPPLPEP